ncbi:MAG: uroporphyrinogen-III C-methyltransferase [Desulfuromonadales bacterium]|nr:uroporphyrinogen-III C-methyltransferase [Desulfuromonadales bacterium]
MNKPGKVYLIGAGPGDPGLITVKGQAILRRAEVIIYDYLANPVLLDLAPKEAERIYVGKHSGCHHFPQEEITRLLLEKACEGKRVIRLKGGDPFIFGRGGEEAQALAAARIPFEVVPGVTAAVAAAAYAGIPLTHRDYTTTLGFITGHEGPDKRLSSLDWDKLAASVGTLVFYMGMANLENICKKLITHGRSPQTPVAVVRWATLPRQETLTGDLTTIAGKVSLLNFKPPAVIFVGEVNSLRDELRWFDNRPLSGRRVLVTRAAEQATELTTALEELGAEAIVVPTIEIIPPASFAELDQAINELGYIDYLVLTSVNAVSAFFDRLTVQGYDARALAGLQTVAVGPKSAEALASHGVNADLMPEDYRAEGIVALLKDRVFGKRLLYPKAALARNLITAELTAAGAEVIAPVAYASAPPVSAAENLRHALADRLDLLTFTASSTVQNFVDLLDAEQLSLAQKIPVASIGPLTSKTARDLGFKVVIEPIDSTLDDLVEAIGNYFKQGM